MDIPEWSPITLSASFLDGQVVVSWNYTSPNNAYVSGFLVERALAPEGPWGFVRFTREKSIHDILDAERYCYRVAVMGSQMATADALRSRVSCVASPAAP